MDYPTVEPDDDDLGIYLEYDENQGRVSIQIYDTFLLQYTTIELKLNEAEYLYSLLSDLFDGY